MSMAPSRGRAAALAHAELEEAAPPPAPPPQPSIMCPALPGWIFVPDMRQAVCLSVPARLRLRYDDMAWIVERTYEAGGALTGHRVSGHYVDEDGAFAALLAICGLRPVTAERGAA
jgi:hypothetical protein